MTRPGHRLPTPDELARASVAGWDRARFDQGDKSNAAALVKACGVPLSWAFTFVVAERVARGW